MKSGLAGHLIVALTAPAAAQFDLFSWSKVPDSPDVAVILTPDSMFCGTKFIEALGFQGVLTRAPVDGRVSVVLAELETWDGNCTAVVPVFWHNGALTQLASCATQNKFFHFLVAEGDVFGLGLKVNSSGWPVNATYTDFLFEPLVPFAFWTELGGGVGGPLRAPTLSGIGLLDGGMPIQLAVGDAPAQQPATLLIGLSALNAPFKGGVLVPHPDVLVPVVLSGTGALELAATWPFALPPDLQFWMQVWIVDPTAPAGLSATNGLLASTP